MKNSGINWVRMDVKKPIEHSDILFREAYKQGINVIAVVSSKRIFKGFGFKDANYLPGSGWKRKWRKNVEEVVSKLGPHVKIWQIENELNHPWHNLLPSLNTKLAVEILEIGADAVKSIDPDAKVTTNLFYNLGGILPFFGINLIRDKPFILRYRQRLENKIDILGMDIYRGTWHGGSPARYPNDLKYYHELWGWDVMITETGYCTGIFGRSEADQANYVKQVFQSLDNYIKKVPWFLGIIWYVYKSSHSGIPCEKYFGLHKADGLTEKPAWREFTDQVNLYNKYNKILGVTYHG